MRNTTKSVRFDRDAAIGLAILLGLALGLGMAIYHASRAARDELEQKCAALGRAGDDACIERQATERASRRQDAALDSLSVTLRAVTPRYWTTESRAVRKRCSLALPGDRYAQNRCYLSWDDHALYLETHAGHASGNYDAVPFGGAVVFKRR